MAITVLRMGHRLHRDFRITTHCGLVSRAFGASRMIFSGDRDDDIAKSFEKVSRSWGGDFAVEYRKQWREIVEEMRKGGALIVLATMYGINLPKVADWLRDEAGKRDVLLIVGSEKMRGEVYHMADVNIAVLNQPHSEVAAIAMILDRLHEGSELEVNFTGGTMEIVPKKKGKMVRNLFRPQ